MKKRNFYSVFILLAIFMISCAPEEKEPETVVRKVKVTTPQLLGDINSRTFAGVIKEASQVNLSFRVAGPIKKIYVKEGDYVKKGQLIAEIDPRDYKTQVDANKAQYEQMKSEYERLTKLNERKSVADNDYEKAVAGEKMLAVQLKHAEDQLNDTKLFAPFSGYIQSVKYDEKEIVNTGMTIATLLDLNSYSIEIEIPASFYILKNKFVNYSCQQPQISDTDYPLTLSGYQVKANNNQLYSMKFKLNPKDNKLLAPGMSVIVKINFKNDNDDSITIPINSIFNKEGQTYVWLFDPETSTVNLKEVVTDGLSGDGRIRIVSGLTEKDTIVVAGVNSLHENEKVNLLQTKSETNIGGLL